MLVFAPDAIVDDAAVDDVDDDEEEGGDDTGEAARGNETLISPSLSTRAAPRPSL